MPNKEYIAEIMDIISAIKFVHEKDDVEYPSNQHEVAAIIGVIQSAVRKKVDIHTITDIVLYEFAIKIYNKTDILQTFK